VALTDGGLPVDLSGTWTAGVDTIPLEPHTFNNCLKTEESSPLAPGDIERKFYFPGKGLTLTVEANGDRVALVNIVSE
jgi:hypothetical protein